MDSSLIFATIFLAVPIFYYFLLLGTRAYKLDKKTKQAPVPAGRLPIIGHLHLLSRAEVPFHQLLARWADQCGPVFNFYVGKQLTVVVSRMEEAKEFFTVNDKCLLSRPVNSLSIILGYNNAMFGAAPEGEHWRGMRKVASLSLLSSRRVDALRNMWESEIRDGVKELYKRCTRSGAQRNGVVDLSQWFFDLMINVMLRVVAGQRNFTYSGEYSEAQVNAMRAALQRFVRLNSSLIYADVIPGLAWSDFQGHKKSMKKTAEEFDEFTLAWIKEHRRMKAAGHVKAEEDQDFIDIMLDLEDKGQLPNCFDADTRLKAAALEYIIDGVETSSCSLSWATAAPMNHPDALKKAQEELDRVVGRSRLVEDADSSKLLHVWAIMKESMRISPATPLLVPREAMEDCTIGGYHVAKGATVMVNVWKLMKDPRIWPDPLEFKPERFLTNHTNMDVRGQHFQLIPFSSGRRSCPGVGLSLRIVPLVLAMLFQAFDLASPTGQPIDMAEGRSMSLKRANEMEVLVTPRLSPDLYV